MVISSINRTITNNSKIIKMKVEMDTYHIKYKLVLMDNQFNNDLKRFYNLFRILMIFNDYFSLKKSNKILNLIIYVYSVSNFMLYIYVLIN